MWISDKWSDYELLDCSLGERLERWGPYLLVRPDPQVIWRAPRLHPGWTRVDGHYHREGGGGRWETRRLPAHWPILYDGLCFLVRPMNFKHTGLFPEQAVNWDFIRETIRNSITRDGRPVRVLNLFAYTGGASAAAAAAGAEVCHVDAAKGMVSWAKENAAASSLSDKPIRWIVDDCREFVRREIRRGHQYEALIMDPPSYGRGPSGEIWKLEDDLFEFLSLCAPLLAQPPLFVLVNAYTTGLSPGAISYLMSSILIPRFGGAVLADELGLPVAQSHLNLPCGATGRWIPC